MRHLPYPPPERMMMGFMENPKPAPLKGTGSRGGHTPNDVMIDKKITQKIRAEDKVSNIDKARILGKQMPKKLPSETDYARKEWKNVLKKPGQVSSEASGTVRFQNFWATFKPRTKFNQEIKKRVMNRTMTEKQAILTIKKRRRQFKKKISNYQEDGKEHKTLKMKNQRIEDELARHDTRMYREGNKANRITNSGMNPLTDINITMQYVLGDAQAKKTMITQQYGKWGEILGGNKLKTMSFDDQENILLKKFHDDKVKKVNDMDNDAVATGYGLGGEKVPGWENNLPATRVADKSLSNADRTRIFGNDFKGKIKHSDFEALQMGTEAGAFANGELGFRINIPKEPKGASKGTDVFIFPKRVTGKSPNIPDNKNTHVHTKGRDPMVFGVKVGEKKEVTQWSLRSRDPLAREFNAPTDGKGAVKSPESWNLGLNPWEQNKQGGDFYTAGQQSYSRDNAKQWRGIGLGLGGVGAMGLGGQSASADNGKRKEGTDRTWKFTDLF